MSFVYWIKAKHHTDMLTEGYIGVANRSVKQRFSQHQSSAARGSSLPVHKALRKYGNDISVVILVEASSEYCYEVENKLRPKPNTGYNIAIGGGKSSTLGVKRSKEAIQKTTEKLIGQKRSQESKMRISKSLKGKPKSEEHRAKIVALNTGRKRSEESKARQSALMSGRKKITEDGRKRLSESKKNLQEWEHSQANKLLWCMADDAYGFMHTAKKFSQRYLAKHFKVKDSQVYSIYKKLKSGWNPNEDADWLSFVTNFKMKELNEQQEKAA